MFADRMWERKMIKEKYFESQRLDIYFGLCAAAFLKGKLKIRCVDWDEDSDFVFWRCQNFHCQNFSFPTAARQIIISVFVFIKNNQKRILPLPSVVFALSGVNICLSFAVFRPTTSKTWTLGFPAYHRRCKTTQKNENARSRERAHKSN